MNSEKGIKHLMAAVNYYKFTASIFLSMAAALFLLGNFLLTAGEKDKQDVINSSKGKITITFIGHGSLQIEFKGKVIHVDPFGKHEDYTTYSKADLVLITHHHFDHLDMDAVNKIIKDKTAFILTAEAYKTVKKGTVLKNGDQFKYEDIIVEAVPAYNSSAGKEKYHPKGRDNGYVLTIGNKKIYIAGDTENVPEMDNLKGIDIAFLPMNQPYTMTPEQVADAAKRIKPRILYPYHTGESDIALLKKLLKSVPGVELRVRDMK